MLITRFVLHGYQPLFMLSHIHHFEIKPTQIYQLIIGTNGCGKSSIMREMTPMPASKDDYAKDGYKTIEFTHRGSSYELTSTFAKGPSHSFLCNGQELNPGGTATVQRELIEQHLGIDNDIMSVLLGRSKFTSMPPMKRRDWVIRLSGNDMDYAMRVFNRLKSKTRDVQGHIKMLNTRLANEVKLIPTPEAIQAIDETCQKLRGELNELLQCREYNASKMEEVQQRVTALMDLIERTAKRITGQQPLKLKKPPVDQEQLTIEIARLKETLTFQREKLANDTDEYNKLKEIIDNLAKLRAGNVADLVNHLNGLIQSRESLMQQCHKGRVVNPEVFRAAFMAIRPQLVEIFSAMPSDLEWDKGRKETNHRERLNELHLLIDRTNEAIIKQRHRLEHIRKSQKVNCPRCNYSWLDGVGENEESQIEHAIETLVATLAKAKEDLKQAEQVLETYLECLAYTRRLNQLVSSNKHLQPLWEDIIATWDNGRTPMLVLPQLSAWEHSLDVAVQLQSIEKEIAEVEQLRERLSNEGSVTINQHCERAEQLEASITAQTTALQIQTLHTQTLETFAEQVRRMTATRQELEGYMSQFNDLMVELSHAVKNRLIDEAITTRHGLLGKAEDSLNKARTAAALIEDLERSKREAELDFEAFTLLTDEMSPVDGLIADQVVGFLDCFTDKINEVLSQIWTYDFRVLPCANAAGELDYKFPMRINASEKRVPDVSEGSTSQVDGIDFAFMLIVRLYLGLDDLPLYLDELAPSLDEQHRLNIVMFAKRFVEMGRCSQMWMISHYAVQSGAFQPSETCVVNANNIVSLPDTYNKHVTLK